MANNGDYNDMVDDPDLEDVSSGDDKDADYGKGIGGERAESGERGEGGVGVKRGEKG